VTIERRHMIPGLTLVMVGAWLLCTAGRLWWHWPAVAALDAALPVVIGGYFASDAVRRNGNAS
jgi:hypothetical protein